ncbi:MAG TPA: TolC family protein [Chitinophagaceae bacterium]|nr:TolC family protein [Chitinophagaceae bacterium]
MKRTTLFLLLLFVLTSPVIAQHYSNSPKNPPTYRPSGESKDTVRLTDVREKLVQLALQNPTYEVVDRQVNKSLFELKKAKGSWLSPLMATGNVNEFSINQDPNVPNFYPRYNFSVTVPLDLFSVKKNDVKIARENVLIAEAEKNQRYRQIRAEVLTAYEDYLMYKEMLDIQARLTQDQQTTLKTREKDFEDGLINAEEYNKYYATYSEQKGKLVEAVRNLNTAKIALESMIGIPLEQALGTK